MQTLMEIRVWRQEAPDSDVAECPKRQMCVLVRAAEMSFWSLFLLDDDGERQRSCGLRSPWQEN